MEQVEFPGAEAPKPEKKGFGLFRKKEKPVGPSISDVLEQITTVDRRLKILEERYTDLNRKIQVTDKNMLDERRIVTREIKVIDSDILELKRQINELRDRIDMIISELKETSRKDDLDALKRYIELWEPVNFATRSEVERMIKEKLEEKKEKAK